MSRAKKSEVIVVSKTNWKLIIAVVIVVVIIILSVFLYFSKYSGANKNPVAGNTQVQDLVEKVSKLIELPKNEEPTIATVSDKKQLPKNAFFANAENGDKVLFYVQAKKAILYSPTLNKIIDVAPFSPETGTSTTPSPKTITPTPTTKPKNVTLLLLNGTSTSGLASTALTRITSKITAISTATKGDSVKNYTKTIIVDPKANKQIDDQLTGLIGGSVVLEMPTGEKPSNADITVILGSDFK